MHPTYYRLFCFALFLFAVACTGPTSKNEKSASQSVDDLLVTSSIPSSEKEIIAQLSSKGFITKTSSGQVIREDQLLGESQLFISSAIQAIKPNTKERKQMIFLLNVAGASLNNTSEAEAFIRSSLLNSDYFESIDKMIKYVQRQDRPVIKKALLNINQVMSYQESLDYLAHTGYIKGKQTNARVIKRFPVFYQIALVDKFRNAPSEYEWIFLAMKKDLNVKS